MVDLKLISYIKSSLKKGYSKEELIKILIKNGWTKKEAIIGFKFLEKHLKEKGSEAEIKKAPLIEFIQTSLKSGISEGEIRLALSAKGWKKATVDNAFKKIKFPVIRQKKEKRPHQLKEKPKPDFKNTFFHIMSFIVISLILSLTFAVFIYIEGLNNYAIIDDQGNELTKTCIQDDCSDMVGFGFSYVYNNVWIYVGVSVLIALIVVILYILLPFKKELLWIFNVLYFLFLLVIIYNWIIFQRG